jgi:hypothetical protein
MAWRVSYGEMMPVETHLVERVLLHYMTIRRFAAKQRAFRNSESKERNHEFPSAAFGRNQENGKKIKWQKDRCSKKPRKISRLFIFLPPDLFAILSSNPDKN